MNLKIVTFSLMIILLALVGIFYYWPNKVDFKPFFKTDSSIPESTLFDIGILKVCGDWGEKPDKEDFRILLDCAHNKDTVQRIYKEYTMNLNIRLLHLKQI